MTRWLNAGLVAAVTGIIWAFGPMASAQLGLKPREDRISVGGASLYVREIGRGREVIVLHGGPDFDHGYLLPDLDRLADTYRLPYYDQRGRGNSAENVNAEVEIAKHVAVAFPGARLATLKNCGHFTYMECPADVRRALTDFTALK